MNDRTESGVYKAKKGRASYGEAIGILLLDRSFATYIPSDVPNVTTYSFPVRFSLTGTPHL